MRLAAPRRPAPRSPRPGPWTAWTAASAWFLCVQAPLPWVPCSGPSPVAPHAPTSPSVSAAGGWGGPDAHRDFLFRAALPLRRAPHEPWGPCVLFSPLCTPPAARAPGPAPRWGGRGEGEGRLGGERAGRPVWLEVWRHLRLRFPSSRAHVSSPSTVSNPTLEGGAIGSPRQLSRVECPNKVKVLSSQVLCSERDPSVELGSSLAAPGSKDVLLRQAGVRAESPLGTRARASHRCWAWA